MSGERHRTDPFEGADARPIADGGERVEVAPVDELGPGERTIVPVDETSIGVFNVAGEFYAIENECRHQHGPVCTGDVHGAILGSYDGPGERVEKRISDRLAITCPWHGWEYDLVTGEHLGSDTISLDTYDVVVEDGTVYLDLDG